MKLLKVSLVSEVNVIHSKLDYVIESFVGIRSKCYTKVM